ncbi:MAG TPA: GspL/Epsl periplasmic domain-containing protein, partial [Steroidobacteraceae bacterium]|nr:GspL/Epsl periplasmic domain-containing protein [Steroidobacteraceae bacterium]
LLDVLDATGQAFAQVPGVTIDALSFRGNVLDLKVAAKDVTSLDRLRTLVVERGMQAELQSSNVREEGVEGRIQIRGRASS